MNLIVPEAKELTTRQLNSFSRGVRSFKDDSIDDYLKAPLVEACTVAIQAAIIAKWFDTKKEPGDALDMAPGEIVKLGKAVILAFGSAQGLAVVEKN